MAFSTKLADWNAALVVDTGASINVLSEEAFLALKRASRGSRYQLRTSSLHLTGVNADVFHILGVARVPVHLGKGTVVINLYFHVLRIFALPLTASSAYRHLSSMVSLLTPTSGVFRMLFPHFNPWLYRRVLPQPQFTIHRTLLRP